MRIRASKSRAARRLAALTAALFAACATTKHDGPQPDRTIQATVQMRPGGPVETAPMGIYEVPVDPPSKSAAEAELADDDLLSSR